MRAGIGRVNRGAVESDAKEIVGPTPSGPGLVGPGGRYRLRSVKRGSYLNYLESPGIVVARGADRAARPANSFPMPS